MSGFTAMLLDDPDGQPFRAPARDAEDVVAISYTSGTTGRPKGVAMAHRNVNSAVENTRRMYFAVTSELRGHRNLISVPLFHVTGCHTQMVTALATGDTCVVMPSFTVSSLIDLIAREHISILISVPTIFSRMLEAPGADAVDVSYVRGIMFGGAPVPPRLVRALRAKFPAARLVNGFGATESTAVLTALPDEYAASQQDPQVRPAAGHRLGQRLAPFGAATEYTAARRRPSYLCSTPVTHPQGDLVSTAPHHHDLPSRVVIAGTTDDGRSCVDIDGPTPHRVVTPVATLNDLWISDSVPTPFTPAFAGSSEEYSVVPPTAYRWTEGTGRHFSPRQPMEGGSRGLRRGARDHRGSRLR